MGDSQNSGGLDGKDIRERVYRRENSLYIDVKDNKVVKATDVIEAITDLCSEGMLYACIAKSGNLYEVTVSDEIVTQFLLGGLSCNGETYEVRPVVNDKVVVSILEVPTYLPDREIESKMNSLDVEIVSPINRKCHKGTQVEDGTRMCTVKLPHTLQSLPYLMKLNDGRQSNSYRVIHDNQVKMCHGCYSVSHMYRDCPEVTCFRCKKKGHFKWTCEERRCGYCYKFTCNCEMSEYDGADNSGKEGEKSDRQNDGANNNDTDTNEEDEHDHINDETNNKDDDDDDGDKQRTNANEHEKERTTAKENDNTTGNDNDNDNENTNESENENTQETVFGDFLDLSNETDKKNTRESPSAQPAEKSTDDNVATESPSVEMKSPKRQRKRGQSYSEQTTRPIKLRVQSNGRKTDT